MDESMAFTCLLELDWYANAPTSTTRGLSEYLAAAWRARRAAGDKIDCLSLTYEMDEELRGMQQERANGRGGR